MNKEVTKIRIRGILAIILSALMLTGIFSCFSALADNVSTEESTTGTVEDNAEESSCVILRADDIVNKLYGPNATVAELVERDGISVVDLTITEETNDAFIYVDLKGYSASRYVAVLARADVEAYTNFSVYYHTSARGGEDMGLGEDAREASPYYFDNGWQFLEFDMKDEDGWGGSIYTFRMDYLEGGTLAAGTKCEIAAIIFSDDAQAINDAAFDLMTEIYSPVQTLSDFKESDAAYFSTDIYYASAVSTTIEVSEGSLIYRYIDNGGSNDPQAMFDYLGYVQANEKPALTTDDFRYMVIRYRAPAISDSVMELFTLTGADAESLFDMIRIDGTYACHSARAHYSRAITWSATVFDMAEDDGLDENTALKYAWYREDGDRTFKGFRADWCTNGLAGYYLEISDFMLYQDAVAANGMAFALSSLTIGESTYWGEEPEETTKDGETGTGEDIVLPPWNPEETTAEETTEETIPEYVNTDEETTEETLEETITPTEESSREEAEGESKPGITINPDGIGGTDGETKEKGSEVPFYVACGALAALSVASVATVVTIRIKEKRRVK